MNSMNPQIWVLVDNRVGGANQAIELAKKLGKSFETKPIEYNSFARLPNSLLSLFPIHIKKATLTALKNDRPPGIIISYGRRIAPLALHLKRKLKGDIKIIQIMRPDIDPKEFEFIILPQHDSFNYVLPNVVRIIGALNNVKDKCLEGQELFNSNHPNIGKFIAVVIGGSTKRYSLNMANAKSLANTLYMISENHSLRLLISFSRRTPVSIKNYFKNTFKSPNIIYDPGIGKDNPYPAMLSIAEYIVATADSISMCSEAASTGKPLYIFCPENFKLQKHNFFIQQLVDIGAARRLEDNADHLEKYEYTPLSEITRVARIINESL